MITTSVSIPANPLLSAALANLPGDLLKRSGSVMYSGRGAFSVSTDLYVLGLNPGGSPEIQRAETIGRWIDDWAHRLPERWSAYVDQSWSGHPPGMHGLQPRLSHLFGQLGRDPRAVPASNLIFARTRNEASLLLEKRLLIEQCWPVHDAVIRSLGIKSIICLGGTVGRWVRDVLSAQSMIGDWREQNARGWRSFAHAGKDDLRVITLTHPGRADWRNPLADPSTFVMRTIGCR